MNKTKKIIYTILFVAVVLITQSDRLFHFSALPNFLGFPSWLLIFAFAHLLLVLLLYKFVNEKETCEDD